MDVNKKPPTHILGVVALVIPVPALGAGTSMVEASRHHQEGPELDQSVRNFVVSDLLIRQQTQQPD